MVTSKQKNDDDELVTSFSASSCHFLKYFRIEFFSFIFIFSLNIEDVTLALLAQDKICMQRFNESNFCTNLSVINASWENSEVWLPQKDRILAEVTTFNFYQTVIYTVPVVCFSFFFGAWADRHSSSTKVLICLTSLMASLESVVLLINTIFFNLNVNIMLFSFIFFALVGGGQTLNMAAMAYVTSTVSIDSRVLRFTIFEIIQIVASPCGIFIGGLIIRSPYLTSFAQQNGQLHNYHQIFMISAAGKFLAFFYALVMPFEKRRKPSPEVPLITEFIPDCIIGAGPGEDVVMINQKIPMKPSRTRITKIKDSMCDLFVLRNVYDFIDVCLKRRPNRMHIFIWLLLISMSIITLTSRSTWVLMFQFVQKIYNWDAGKFSTYNSVLYLGTHVFGLLIATPFMTKVLKMSDNTLLMVGLISLMLQNFIRGSLFTELAFCTSYFFGSITGLIPVAIKSKLSKMCPMEELNRIFCVMTTLDTIAPLVGIAIYTAFFNATISSYPGFVFQLSCFLLLIPFVLATIIALQMHVNEDCKMPSYIEIEGDNNNNSSTIQNVSNLIQREQQQSAQGIIKKTLADTDQTSDYSSGADYSVSIRNS